MRNAGFILAVAVSFLLASILAGCSGKSDRAAGAAKVKIEQSQDGSVKVTDKKTGAEMIARAGVAPTELSIKLYPNATTDESQQSMKVDIPQGTLINAFFTVPEGPEKVIEFYSREVRNAYTAKNTRGATIIGKTGSGNDVTVVISEKGSASKIYVQETMPKK